MSTIPSDQGLEGAMRRKIEFRKAWFESEYDPGQHGNPYSIMFRDMIEVAAEHIMRKAISEFVKAQKSEPMYGGTSSLPIRDHFADKVPRPATAVQRFI